MTVLRSSFHIRMWISNINFMKYKHFISKQALRRRTLRFSDKQLKTEPIDACPPGSHYLNNLESVNHSKNLIPVLNNIDNFQQNENEFKKIMLSLKRRKFRERKQKLILEGLEVICIALSVGIKLEKLFYTRDETLNSIFERYNPECVSICKITDRVMRDFSDHSKSPEVLAICQKPASEHLPLIKCAAIPVTVLCSDIRDPSNMGSILTIAAAAGCERLILTKGCVDVWGSKVLKAANGVQFQMPIVNNIAWRDIRDYISQNSAFYVADSSSDIDIDAMQMSVDVGCENIAEQLSVCKNEDLKFDLTFPVDQIESRAALQPFDDTNLSCKLYSEVSFPQKEIVLYVGGETKGISRNAEKLAEELDGVKIKLPLENGMDSLNVCVALSIMLYEIKRQFMQKRCNIQ